MSGTPRILTVFPPNFAEINRAFKTHDREVIYAFGDTIYNPRRIKIPPYLIAHERVHLGRQLVFDGGAPEWWRRYIDDPKFRLDEELPAHIAEYQQICSVAADAPAVMAKALDRIATRLASPLYGNLVGVAEAKERIAYAGKVAAR